MDSYNIILTATATVISVLTGAIVLVIAAAAVYGVYKWFNKKQPLISDK